MNTNIVPLAGSSLPPVEEAPKQALAVIRSPADELKAARKAREDLGKSSYEVSRFQHATPLAGQWGWPIALSVLGAGAAAFLSVEVAAAIAGVGAVAGGSLRAMLPAALRRTKAAEVKAITTTIAAPSDAGSAEAVVASQQAKSILQAMAKKGINDPQAREALEKLVARHDEASPEEKKRAETWAALIEACDETGDNNQFLNAFNCLDPEEREAAAGAVYDDFFSRTNYRRSWSDYYEIFDELRTHMPSPYPEPTIGPPTGELADKRRLLTDCVREFVKALTTEGIRYHGILSSAELAAIASGDNDTPRAPNHRDAMAYFFAPERTDLERCFIPLLLQAHSSGRTSAEMRAAGEALRQIEKLQPESAKAEASRLFDALSVLTDRSLAAGYFDRTLPVFDKLDAATELGIKGLFAL